MDKPWWLPIASPLDDADYNPDPIPHPPITTRLGRVVYDRKRHYWSENDLARVLGHVFDIQEPRRSGSWWMSAMERATIWMIDKLLDSFVSDKLPDEIATRIYYLTRDWLAKIIDKLLPQQRADLTDQVSGGAH